MGTDREALAGAANRFVAFFRELDEAFVERGDLLQQMALALLGRQHLLMTGPPGTAKSKLAEAVLGRIHCEETRQSSLFSRQFTESTVQTDLVGPIDFKTLMETGRTEHFTDEGMLGAAHAFLDEVFDGRDMLLRSTLNLLNERELKQGTRVSRGKIECAVMTTNRYLAEVLENERLLAFVDRIAFLSFVPKGFAGAGALGTVLLRQVAGRNRRPLEARLSIQDLDLLQDAVESVVVSEAMCASLAALVQSFEAGVAAARRADATFVPSRYVSTRGVVRLGELLRAVCLHDWAFHDRDRPLAARPGDLAGLRLGLTLCGPSAAETVQLLSSENDPRERRQLEIVLCEREIFDRCLQALPTLAENERPPPVPVLARSTFVALRTRSTSDLAGLARELASASGSDAAEAAELESRLAATVRELCDRILDRGLRMGGSESRDPLPALAELANMADEIETASAGQRPAVRWLRGKALDLVTQMAALGPSPFAAGAQHQAAASGHLEAMRSIIEIQLLRSEQLASLRAGLRQAGAQESEDAGNSGVWRQTVDSLSERLAPDLAAGIRARIGDAGGRVTGGGLGSCLDDLGPLFALVRGAAARIDALGGDGQRFFSQVVAGPLTPLVQQGFDARNGDRTKIIDALKVDLAMLGEAGLLAPLPVPVLALSMATAVLRASVVPAAATAGSHDVRLYRQLRSQMPRETLAFTLVELLSHLPGVSAGQEDPDQIIRRVADLVRAFPAEVRARLLAADRAYIEAPVAFLEAWWAELSRSLPPDHDAALPRLMESSFFNITHVECALARFELEARLVELVLDEAKADLGPLRERIAALLTSSVAVYQGLARQRLEGAAAGPPPAAAARPR